MSVESRHLWNVWLKFDDTRDEEEFRAARCHSISTLSGQTHGIALLIGITAFCTNVRHDHHSVLKLCTFHDCIFVPLIVVYLSWRHNRLFTKRYDWIVILAQAAIGMSAAHARQFLDPIKTTSLGGALGHFFTLSPLAAIVLMGVSYRTSIHMQYIGQLVTVILARGWVGSCCRGAGVGGEVDRVLDTLGWTLERFFGGMGTMFMAAGRLVREEGVVFPCWMLAGYFHFAAGLVLPCTVKYVLECHSRAKFLACKFHKDSHELIWSHFWDACWFSFFVALTALLLGWMVFRSVVV